MAFRPCSTPPWRQVLAYVYRLKAALRGEGRMPEALVPPEVPPELDPLQRAHTVGDSA